MEPGPEVHLREYCFLVINTPTDRNLPVKISKLGKSEMKRKSMGSHQSKSNFSRHAATTHKYNIQAKPMRGGIRM
ncbi:hypothetical protein [Blackfly microvirus SF02]|uniref:Uncharacterized protein n=1 Tax=Blackfly microvirus SF02 TaxID=2576452 RepID=A0A4P8PQ20_9VIRU|nr:hypothetical protein [Blackfly microvirus SF02]